MMTNKEDKQIFEIQTTSIPKKRNIRFIILISVSIVISMILVVVAMYLYQKSGAAQLDLSRPAYEDVRSQAQESDMVDDFNATGKLDEEALKEFKKTYQDTAEEIKSRANKFAPEAIDNKTLSIEVK